MKTSPEIATLIITKFVKRIRKTRFTESQILAVLAQSEKRAGYRKF
jgi:hypothetical protein